MVVSAEISYYPMVEEFNDVIDLFIKRIKASNAIVKTGAMSTVISGNYSEVMELLAQSMRDFMQEYPSVFNIKISNSCIV